MPEHPRIGQIWWSSRRLAFAHVWRVKPDYILVNVLKRAGGRATTETWARTPEKEWSLYYQPSPIHIARSTADDIGLDVEGWMVARNGRAHWFKERVGHSACGSVQYSQAKHATYSPGENWPCATCVARANAEARERIR